ncbi:MAG: radical SAM protein [Eubacterium sp.]|nr:radical SAM protein [Eubacterium sp.]
MYYKLRQDILFRQYEEYGYITDNSEYGYRMLDDTRPKRNEKFVSQSGAVMLSTLERIPKHIDIIVEELSRIYIGVDFETLKSDTIEFFQYFVEEGYLSVGESAAYCQDIDISNNSDITEITQTASTTNSDECGHSMFKTNEFLRSLHIEIANACNERCVHCYIPHKYKNDVMDPELFYRIIEDGRKMNIMHVTLSGGEPLLNKAIIQFLQKCRESDLSVNLLSNLIALSDEVIEEMKRNPFLSVQTSIYAMNPEIHDSITKVSGSLEKTLAGIEQILAAGIPVQISCPVIKQNKDAFEAVIRWGFEHKIAVAVEPVIFASYDHTGDNLPNRLSVEEIGKAVEVELAEGYGDSICSAAKEKEAFKANDPICSICRYSFCIAVNGDVYPCVGWQTNVLGNVHNQSIIEIWNTSEKIKQLRQVKRKDFPKCVDCKDRGFCTVCMMSNSNENNDGNAFRINDFQCSVAALTHQKVDDYMNRKSDR